MSQQTQDPEYVGKVSEHAVDTFYEFNCTDMEESNRGLDDALMSNVIPDILAAINAQDTNLDDFNVDEIDYETLNANIFPFPGLYGLLQEQSVHEQQPQPWSQQSHQPQTPRGCLQQLIASPQPMQQPRVQTQAPLVEQESPSRGRLQGISQQLETTRQSTTSHLTVPIPTERQGELRYQIPVLRTATSSRPMAADKKPSNESSGDKKQKKASGAPQAHISASPQVPAQAPRPIAAAAPQAMQFASFAECIDRATVANFDSHWETLSPNPPTSPITPAQITTICWKLLSIAIDLHTRGPICLNVYDRAKLKNVYKFRGLKFSERIDKVCELMRMSKARCGSLLKLDGLEMVVATASLLCTQTKSNYKQNRTRQHNLVEGNLIVKKKRKVEKFDENESGDEEEEEERGDVESE
ncbi:uncharacterized protein ALTATR162_LOCUS6899 [Alternaria atra]|uniref:Uncharacterized protein n=1 Tax=Alternaria atra TaxID=119953 RepID=A0A8J2I2G2_9PLEO|nr:uncharacterized protein ALTATR162_LOCUS6899 [Alternaria atra]CAG5166251.1 unnamed protein product [Alternaria atra]